MSEKKLTYALHKIAERDIPHNLDLWPGIKNQLGRHEATLKKPQLTQAMRLGWASLGVVLLLAFATTAYAAYSGIPLTMPSSVLIGEKDPHIRILGRETSCSLQRDADEIFCEVPFEGQHLDIHVEVINGMQWKCDATYGGEAVPCRASFDALDLKTYVVIESNLGLTDQRYQELAKQTANKGWNESDWELLATIFAIGVGALASVLTWKWQSNRTIDLKVRDRAVRILAILIIGGIVFSVVFYGTMIAMVLLRIID